MSTTVSVGQGQGIHLTSRVARTSQDVDSEDVEAATAASNGVSLSELKTSNGGINGIPTSDQHKEENNQKHTLIGDAVPKHPVENTVTPFATLTRKEREGRPAGECGRLVGNQEARFHFSHSTSSLPFCQLGLVCLHYRAELGYVFMTLFMAIVWTMTACALRFAPFIDYPANSILSQRTFTSNRLVVDIYKKATDAAIFLAVFEVITFTAMITLSFADLPTTFNAHRPVGMCKYGLFEKVSELSFKVVGFTALFLNAAPLLVEPVLVISVLPFSAMTLGFIWGFYKDRQMPDGQTQDATFGGRQNGL
jgi:hypothetical protein